ncbi:MAG: hypothetical protein ACXABY_20000 [Candidatus Thorarchaeota archaeon]|jgi:hypothetical protein
MGRNIISIRTLDIIFGFLGIAMGIHILTNNVITQTMIVTSMIIVFTSFTLIAVQLIIMGFYITQRTDRLSYDSWSSIKHGTGIAFIGFGILFQIMAIMSLS